MFRTGRDPSVAEEFHFAKHAGEKGDVQVQDLQPDSLGDKPAMPASN
jgi:hypothetical protein